MEVAHIQIRVRLLEQAEQAVAEMGILMAMVLLERQTPVEEAAAGVLIGPITIHLVAQAALVSS